MGKPRLVKGEKTSAPDSFESWGGPSNSPSREASSQAGFGYSLFSSIKTGRSKL